MWRRANVYNSSTEVALATQTIFPTKPRVSVFVWSKLQKIESEQTSSPILSSFLLLLRFHNKYAHCSCLWLSLKGVFNGMMVLYSAWDVFFEFTDLKQFKQNCVVVEIFWVWTHKNACSLAGIERNLCITCLESVLIYGKWPGNRSCVNDLPPGEISDRRPSVLLKSDESTRDMQFQTKALLYSPEQGEHV